MASLFAVTLRCSLTFTSVRSNCYRASIGKVKRKLYVRLYPCLMVNPDGSTYTVRYREPRAIIKLPIDIKTLSDDERRLRLAQRTAYKAVQKEEKVATESFTLNKYSFLIKNKKN